MGVGRTRAAFFPRMQVKLNQSVSSIAAAAAAL